MINRIKSNLAFLVIPVTVLSTQSGPTVKTEVKTIGNGQVKVQNNVDYNSSSKSEVNLSDKIYKKIEIEVNGKKQVVESTQSGTTSLNVLGEATASTSVSAEGQKPAMFKQEQITISEYIWEQLQKTIAKVFGGFFGR